MDSLLILKDKRVLYVEDEDIVRESITKTLSFFFDNITIAKDGKEAISFIDNDFDIIILDFNLPEYNGIDIAKVFRAKSDDTIIFIISSHYETENLREAMQIGAIDYLPKPMRYDDLLFVLKKCATRLPKQELKYLGDNLTYNMKLKSVFKNDKEIRLTKNEVVFLELILSYKKQLLHYEVISKELFNSANIDSNIPSIKNTLFRLRKKLGIPLVDSIFGIGYRVL
jgi:DNA-binding response OmpR family regulator